MPKIVSKKKEHRKQRIRDCVGR